MGTLEAIAHAGGVVLAQKEGQNVGFLAAKPQLVSDPRVFPILAAAVPADLQRLSVGLSMLHALATTHQLGRERVLQAICRQDLPSNVFWAAAGFRPIGVRFVASSRAIPSIIWRRRVDGESGDFGFYLPEPRQRMGGGRFIPKDRPDLASIIDYSDAAIEAACRVSGARPKNFADGTTDWDRPQVTRPTPVIRPDRPNDPQLTLFRPTPTADAFRG